VIESGTFGGFPRHRSPLDMYDHLGCAFTGLVAVRSSADSDAGSHTIQDELG
jgi:hypothetical protein